MKSKLFVEIGSFAFTGAILGSIVLYPLTWIKWGSIVGIIFMIIAFGIIYKEQG